MEKLRLKHISVPKAHVFSITSSIPQLSLGLQQGWSLGARPVVELLWSRGSRGKGSGSSFRWPGTFSLTVPSLRTLCAQPAQGSQQKTPSLSSAFLVNTVSLSSWTCCSPSLHFWGHLWAGFSGTSRVLCLGQSWGLWLLPGPRRNTFEENLRKQSACSRWIVVEWMGLLPSGNPREQEWVYMFSYFCTWQFSHSVHLKTNSDSVPGYFYTATGNTRDVFVLREKHCFQGCLLE